jgi:hypothetical protein
MGIKHLLVLEFSLDTAAFPLNSYSFTIFRLYTEMLGLHDDMPQQLPVISVCLCIFHYTYVIPAVNAVSLHTPNAIFSHKTKSPI